MYFVKLCECDFVVCTQYTAAKMSRHQLSRVDRVAQMSIQEEIIAKKKLELIEKQKTTELAKQVSTLWWFEHYFGLNRSW